MAKTGAIKIQNELLVWARLSIGLSISDAAKEAKLEAEDIKKWESEPSDIPISKLKKLAKVYKRPLTTFFLKNPPEKDIVPPDFRTLDSVKIDSLSKEARLAIRRAQRNRKFYASLMNEIGQNRPRLMDISFADDPKEVAAKFRKILNINTETQFDWSDEYVALYNWVDVIEQVGIPVFHMDLPLKEFRGFCLRGNELPPAIVINRKDRVRGRIFTLFHEFYHLHLKERDIEQLTNSKGVEKAHMLIEMKANEFAGSFLVPQDVFLSLSLTKAYIETRDDELITRLRNLFKVSSEVIYRRLVVHGILSEAEYQEKHKKLLNIYKQEEIKRKAKNKESNKPFIPNIPREIANTVGYSLGAKAFDAVAAGKLTTYELVSFLNAKVSYLSKIKDQINQHYRRAQQKHG